MDGEGGGGVPDKGYARKHIDRMIDRGQQRNARNYELALQHMERFAGTTRIMFSHLTSNFVARWIQSLEQTHRAKEMYPICMRQVFKAAQLEINDYDNGIIRIKTNPWVKVQIPKADRTEKLAITPEACREFFSFPLPESKMKLPLMELGRDVAMMVLCLAGINTVDLFNLRREDYHGGIIHYQRAKTKKFRADGAYMEMRVPAIILPLFEKYANKDERDEHLFDFYSRHTSYDSFSANVNGGIRQVCEAMGSGVRGDGHLKGRGLFIVHVPAHMGHGGAERLRSVHQRGGVCDEPQQRPQGDTRVYQVGLHSGMGVEREGGGLHFLFRQAVRA